MQHPDADVGDYDTEEALSLVLERRLGQELRRIILQRGQMGEADEVAPKIRGEFFAHAEQEERRRRQKTRGKIAINSLS